MRFDLIELQLFYLVGDRSLDLVLLDVPIHQAYVRCWPIVTDIAPEPNVRFWGVSSTGRRNTTRWGTPAVALEQFLH
jgi:hypothetical protein